MAGVDQDADEVTDEATDEVTDATPADAQGCAGIYAHYVTTTAATFELEPPTPAQMAERITASQARHAWLVLRREGAVVGYAYGTTFRARPAYRWSCEVSAYLHPDHRGRGGGRTLYTALLTRLAARGLHTATAGVALPNPASLALHAALGFTKVGTFHRVGWKHGTWHDVTWLERPLTADHGADAAVPPDEPR